MVCHRMTVLMRCKRRLQIEAIENMIKYKVAKETILQDYSEEEYEEAEKAMLVES